MTALSQKTSPQKQLGFLALILVLVAVGGGLYWFFKPKPLVLSGLVQAQEMRDASRYGGRVEKVFLQEGQAVESGQPIVLFENAEIIAKMKQAKAALAQAEANESLLSEGASIQDRKQSYAMVKQAEQAVRINQKSAASQISQAEAQVQAAQSGFDQAKQAFDSAPQMLEAGVISQQRLNVITGQYHNAMSALKAAQETLKQTRSAARNEELKIAQSKLEAARANYSKVSSGARKEELDIGVASTDQAKSQLEGLEAQLSELKVTAKIPGIVSVFTLLPGDLVLPGQPIVSIINYDNLWTDVYVPESDLSRVQIGQPVTVHASAYPKNVVFSGKVVSINPKSEFVPDNQASETGEENSFKVKVSLNRLPYGVSHGSPQGIASKEASSKKLGRSAEKQTQLYPGMNITVRFEPIP